MGFVSVLSATSLTIKGPFYDESSQESMFGPLTNEEQEFQTCQATSLMLEYLDYDAAFGVKLARHFPYLQSPHIEGGNVDVSFVQSFMVNAPPWALFVVLLWWFFRNRLATKITEKHSLNPATS